MAKIKSGEANATKFFNLNGIDYPLGEYTIFYDSVEKSSAGVVDSASVEVGIQRKARLGKSQVIQEPVVATEWVNGSDVAYTTLNGLLIDLVTLLGL